MRTILAVCAAVSLSVAGCAHKKVLPPSEQTVSLGGKKATWRDWTVISPCDVQPMVLQSDFESMNALLGEYLGATSGRLEGIWSDEQVALLEESVKKLPDALKADGKALAELGNCQFTEQDQVTEAAAALKELLRQAQSRVNEAPARLPIVKARLAVAKWKVDEPQERAAARAEWCGGKLKPGAVPDVYFATTDETGQGDWHFCDDTRVTAPPGGAPHFVAPAEEAGKKAPKRADPKKYVEAALRYPETEVKRSPKLPAEPQPRKAAEESGEVP